MNAFFILTRIDSSRLPAKALLSLGGKTILETIIDQLKDQNDYIPVVLTTDRTMDDCIENVASQSGCYCYRGELENVSMRIVGAIKEFEVKSFFRVNGDSPCLDLDMINKAIEMFSREVDFVTNLISRTFPYGVAVELFQSEFYIAEQSKFITEEHFEHPMTFIYRNLEKYTYKELLSNQDFSNYSMTIDTLQDYLKFLKILRFHRNYLSLDLKGKIDILNMIDRD